METRANYVLIGLFTLLVIVGGFAFGVVARARLAWACAYKIALTVRCRGSAPAAPCGSTAFASARLTSLALDADRQGG